MIDRQIVSWAQYLHWAEINFNRYICDEGETAEEIAKALLWFASEYVVIEGWRESQFTEPEIEGILERNAESIEILRRARNAVFHFQKEPYEKRIMAFAVEFERDGWLVDLHEAFLRFLRNFPRSVYPYDERFSEFEAAFYEIIGWQPRASSIT